MVGTAGYIEWGLHPPAKDGDISEMGLRPPGPSHHREDHPLGARPQSVDDFGVEAGKGIGTDLVAAQVESPLTG